LIVVCARVSSSSAEHSSHPAADAVEKVADTFPVDGLWMDKSGSLYLSDLQQNAVVRRSPDGKMQTMVTDQRLRWPDTFTEGTDGFIYVTASHINEAPRFNHGKDARAQSYTVFRFHP
jgi:sugar lactone lactonase YvrE